VKKCLMCFVNQGPINSADAFGLGGTLNVGSIQVVDQSQGLWADRHVSTVLRADLGLGGLPRTMIVPGESLICFQ
jgi:hypothetical protein